MPESLSFVAALVSYGLGAWLLGIVRKSDIEASKLGPRATLSPSPSLCPMRPEEIAYEEHRDYYAAGGYGEDRLRWTVNTFLAVLQR